MKHIILVLLALAIIITKINTTPRFTVSHCHDGDTCTIQDNHEASSFKLRIKDLDCPELHTNEGKLAKQLINTITSKAKSISIELDGTQSYGRLVGYSFIDGKGINNTMISSGLCKSWIFYK